jgi:hypothetical protein
LTDAFETTVADVVRERRLCNPVAIDGEEPGDPATHLACYALRLAPGEEPLVPEQATIENRFGTQTIRFLPESSDRTLCVAAEAHLAGTQADEAGERQSLRCRRARSVPRLRLDPAPELELADELETKRMRVRQLHALCTPVAQDGQDGQDGEGGEEIADPAAALACYQVAQTPRQPAFRPPGTIELASALGTQSVIVRNGQRMLCVPTRIE